STMASMVMQWPWLRCIACSASWNSASVISPAYIAEVAPARYRGRLATVQQIAIITGLTAAFLSNYLLAAAAGASTEPLWGGQAAWRW
ncbi:MFS transporter, partial [Enterobacter hormaechei]|uniref:MFS transporter n=1 Tax=Enterobacter hormaechei TaxID=158836 RepID=UPI0019539F26